MSFFSPKAFLKPRRVWTRPPAIPTDTAAEKLMMLSCRAVCALIVNHMLIRAAGSTVDHEALRDAGHKLCRIADEAERNAP